MQFSTGTFNEVLQNDQLLKWACLVSKQLTLADYRVQDAWGGYCANKSPSLPSATTRRRILRTKSVQLANRRMLSTYNVRLFLKSDRQNATYNNTIVANELKSDAMKTALVAGISAALYGAPTLTSAEITEQAVQLKPGVAAAVTET